MFFFGQQIRFERRSHYIHLCALSYLKITFRAILFACGTNGSTLIYTAHVSLQLFIKSPILFLKQIQLLSLAERARYDATIAGALYKRTSDGAKWQLRWFTLYQVITGKANNTCCSCCFTAVLHCATPLNIIAVRRAIKCPQCPFHL